LTGIWLRRIAMTLVIVIGLFAVFTARVVSRGTEALAKSDTAFDRGDLETSVLEARVAALAYAPGAPHVSAAYERLAAIARGAEAEGRYVVARTAWGAIERAAVETNHWFDMHAAERDEARAGLARLDTLAARQNPPSPDSRGKAAPAPAVARSSTTPGIALLALSFVLLVAGLAWCAVRGVTGEGSANRKQLLFGFGIALSGAACWLLALLWR
jgi:hypothetical protein